ncbi:isochorismate synthase [soil metagenome]
MRAVTRPLDVAVDLNDVARGDGHLFVRNAVGFAGRGCAARVSADEATEFLADIEHDDIVGDTPGPIAIGSIPFVPGAAAELLVPAVLVGKDELGRAWVTTIDDADVSDTIRLATSGAPLARTNGYRIHAGVPVEQYLHAVSAARDAVRAGLLTKAVIARPVMVEADEEIDVHAVLHRLKASFGSSYRYSIDGLVGASPELLVEVRGDVVRSHPLAGTAPRTGDPDRDAALAADLIASTKDQVEHRVVIEMVHDTLLPWVSYLDWQPEPSIVTVANVQHLGSEVEGRLSQPGPSAVELVRVLSPTPALGGHPRDDALALIAEVEGFERGRYGGAVGWVDGHGDGSWAVTIRCAELSADRRSARLVAGGGIVADSDPRAELAETQAKLQAMLSAIVRP